MCGKLEDHVFLVLLNLLFCLDIYSTENPLQFSFNISQVHTGFHRHLCYDVSAQNMADGTKMLIEETFSKDMYIDPFQVSERNEIYIKDTVDCELPAYLANEFNVQICSMSENKIHHICIPFHLRYQPPHQCKILGESLTVFSKIPGIFFSKLNQSYTLSSDCFMNKVNDSWIYVGHPKVDPLKFEVPVGCVEHFHLVLFFTVSVVCLSFVYLSNNLLKECDNLHLE